MKKLYLLLAVLLTTIMQAQVTVTEIGRGISAAYGLAVGSDGSVYVVNNDDLSSGRASLLKIQGNTITSLSSALDRSFGVTVDAQNHIFVAESDAKDVREFDPQGNVIATISLAFQPYGIALASDGDFYLSDVADKTIVKLDPKTGQTTTIAGGFSAPIGIALDNAGNIYVADNGSGVVKKIDIHNNNNVIILGSGFGTPISVAVDNIGNIYVADENGTLKRMDATGNNIITLADYNTSNAFPAAVALDSAGDIYAAKTSTLAGFGIGGGIIKMDSTGNEISTFGADGVLAPIGVAVDATGDVFTTNLLDGTIKEIQGYKVTTIATVADFKNQELISGIALDPTTGNIYVGSLQQVPVVKIFDSTGNSLGTFPGVADAGIVNGIVIDKQGNIYLAGSNGVWKFDRTILTFKALGAGFSNPGGVALDGNGNVYVADTGNNQIKRMNAQGNNITVLGSGFSGPKGVAVDQAGNVYVADTGNNAVKEISAGGTVTTLATGINQPTGIAVDNHGAVYVTDPGQSHLYKITQNSGNLAVSNVNKNVVRIAPNPFADVVMISDIKNVSSVVVTDALGRTVLTSPAVKELNLSTLSGGMYFIVLKMKNGAVNTIKMIKR